MNEKKRSNNEIIGDCQVFISNDEFIHGQVIDIALELPEEIECFARSVKKITNAHLHTIISNVPDAGWGHVFVAFVNEISYALQYEL